jgi:predicted metalloprotease with PDZ domain
MKRKFVMALLLPALLLLLGVGDSRSQERPEPPEPPEGPEVIMGGEFGPEHFFADGAAWLGVTVKDVTADMARDLKLPGEYGALVESVEADSAGAKAGLQKGDVIVEFAGERVRSVTQLRRLIRETPADRTVSLQVIRNGRARTLSAKLESRKNLFYVRIPETGMPEPPITAPNPRLFDFRGFSYLFGGKPTLGISGDDLTTQLAGYFGVKQGKGVLVREVVVGSPAEKAGLRAGDVIVAVDGKSVATVVELRQAVESKPSEEERKLNLTVVRDHHELIVTVQMEKAGVDEHEKAAAGFGVDAGEWQPAEAQAKAQIAAARLALEDAQRELHDQQRQVSDKARQAVEEYQRAIQEQLRLQLQEKLRSLAGQNEAI